MSFSGFLGALHGATSRGLGSLGGSAVASDEEKVSLTQAAISINSQSQTFSNAAQAGALENAARALTARLDSYQAWPGGGSPVNGFVRTLSFGLADAGDRWDASQTIRANLQGAISNVRVRTGAREGTVHGQQHDTGTGSGETWGGRVVQDVKSGAFQSQVASTARNLYRDAADTATAVSPWAKVALGVAAVVAVGYAAKQIRGR